MKKIVDKLKKSKKIVEYKHLLQKNKANIRIDNISLSVFACVCKYVFEDEKFIFLAQNDFKAKKAQQDFSAVFDEESIIYFPENEYMLYDISARSTELHAERMKCLYTILQGKWKGIIVTPSSLAQWLPNPRDILNREINLKVGDFLDIRHLARNLVDINYKKTLTVDGMGQFSVRGDIVDVFPYGEEKPYRIEFFDDEIDTIRIFDEISQRTIRRSESVSIYPDNECCIWSDEHADNVKEVLKRELNNYDDKSNIYHRISDDIQKIEKYRVFEGYDRYIPYIIGNVFSLFDYTGQAAVFVDNYNGVCDTLDNTIREHIKICNTINDNTGIPKKTYEMYMSLYKLEEEIEENSKNITFLNEFCGTDPWVDCEVIDFNYLSSESFCVNIDMMLDKCNALAEGGYDVYIFSQSEGNIKRFAQLKEDRKLSFRVENILKSSELTSGFICEDIKLAVFTDSSVFKIQKAKTKKKLKGAAITSFADIEPGDLVVHNVHGIGRFEKIEGIVVDNIRKDYIKINYRDDGVLYVPTHQLDSLEKYIGPQDHEPKLNKLGTEEWNKTTAKVKASLRTYAKELVELYAKRSQIKGFSFSKDTVWQREFEDAFIYEETADQLRCSSEIKSDMELDRPMDRLLCGDVGYGKTEVALRAVFKAVCDGKQVAFLVPTTVLAQQHYTNFVQRFADFPVTVDYLCRFRSTGDKKKIIENLKKGKIDVLVGTHSIIQDKIQFKDLGLIVIDEEQRFGVLHKEKLKTQYPAVDVLSMSATPIPRTLHMSLSGIRDISIIEDPPKNRQPVQTYVAPWDNSLIKNAIYREMGRGGQIFYLYNRVKNMEEKKLILTNLVPEAKVAIAHGQMSESMLESIMEDFYNKEYDVLLCTTIIESGLDMPNVNTVIVEDSDRFGLAQLYQIRGRVGRSKNRAYAYVTYKKNKNLSEIAEKRLKTIRDFTEFGSGFKIALRDLELRGAGSVLGERQHGQLAQIGYDTYCRLLDEVICEEKGVPVKNKPAVSVEFRLNAYIQSDYIPSQEERLDIYQKIARVETQEDAYEMTDELIDRYGYVPEVVENLITISRIRYLCGLCGIEAVIQRSFDVQFIMAGGNKLVKPLLSEKDKEILGEILDFLTQLTKNQHCKNE